ncbi:cytochrome P450 [Dendrothele bispora CBS 962.96]|uniref:Cytochrome P450 n=1 Tax=Dendrothele bispora (strain CBS 962.96) TaxID=1314807 RepID=A0A4S8MP46_DENBC|nr:cytochrome P450 [Dendrothele bispora CBS 962.96]
MSTFPAGCLLNRDYGQLAVSILFIYVAYLLFSYRRQLPPGPKPLPVIGNAHQMPTLCPEETFQRWQKEYGDIVHVRIFGSNMLILNTFQDACELLEKRSALYSDRPRFVLFNEFMGWHNASTHVRYGPRFRKHRRFIHQTFNEQAARSLRPIQERETLTLIRGLMESPEQYSQHVRRFAAASIMKVTYGKDVTSVDDPFVLLAERAGSLTVQSGTPAATLVDFFPIIKYLPEWAPMAGFKRNARVVKQAVDDMMNVPFEMVRDQMKAGTAPPCLTSRLLESFGESITFQDEEDIKGVAGTMYAAAEDTTTCVLLSFILAMVLHPHVFGKAQKEMDRVIGVGKLPTLEDRKRLPYLECVLKEVYRWNPPVPLGLPHRLMQDDVYDGYYIPKGATILANIYAMLQGCSDPKTFRPERYLEQENAQDCLDPQEVVFGFGRRRCPGRYFADAGIWLVIASLVASTDIAKARDEQGREIIPEVEFETGFVRHPKSFPCSITPRSGEMRNLIDKYCDSDGTA